jgi:uncharacterized glyoxalase superfamily protein PhnB
VQAATERGVGAELRFLGIDPDEVQKRANRAGTIVLQSAKSYAHGWREITLLDPDGYIWTVGLADCAAARNRLTILTIPPIRR